jgi:eukaryotic-like serine/threonine-protein kinase
LPASISGGIAAMAQHFKLKEIGTSGVRLVEVSGVLDASLDVAENFAPLAGHATPIVFDLDQVRRITSIGVRQWVDGLARLQGIEYFFIRCRTALMMQFNMIASFGGNGHLLTVYLPYVCPRCGGETEHLLDLRHEHDRVLEGKVPEHSCDACGMPTDFDDDPESYFAYVADTPPPIVPPAVAVLMDDGTKTSYVPLKVKKEVADEVTSLWLSGTLHENARFKRLTDGLDGTVAVVAQGIGGVTALGLRRLLDALVVDDAELYLARVPVDMAAAMVAMSSRAPLPVVSLWLPMRCVACGERRDEEVDAAALAALDAGQVAPCARCGGARAAAVTADVLAAARKVPLVSGPAALLRYLAARTALPVEADSARRLRNVRVSGSPPGELLLDGYDVIRRLGLGGMAEVLLARQLGPEGFHKQVALKRILPQLATDPIFVDMFLREARLAVRINHPNVVQIHDLRRTDTDYFIVMEYVHGWNLDEVVKTAARAGATLPVELACRIAADVCAGLHAAHTAHDDEGRRLVIVHRDVSPHNVLVSRTGSVKLTDFGVAKAANATSVTKTEGLKGKFHYMAPERMHGGDADERSDIYAAGLVLYLLLTGKHPFQRETEYDTWLAAIDAGITPPSRLRPDLPASLERIVLRAVEKDRGARHASAQELQLGLEAFLTASGRPVTSAHLGRWLDTVFTGSVRPPDPIDPVGATTPGFLIRKKG